MPSKTDYLLIGLGALLAVLLAAQIPAIVAPMSGSSPVSVKATGSGCSSCGKKNQLSLQNIPGIDLNALNICIENGLM